FPIRCFHDLETLSVLAVNPTGMVNHGFREHPTQTAEALPDRLGITISKALNDHEQHDRKYRFVEGSRGLGTGSCRSSLLRRFRISAAALFRRPSCSPPSSVPCGQRPISSSWRRLWQPVQLYSVSVSVSLPVLQLQLFASYMPSIADEWLHPYVA